MTPAETIAALDRQLAKHGEDVSIIRYTAPSGNPRPKVEVPGIKAFVRPVKAEELAGNIDQTASNVVVSPTDVTALLPLKKGDKVVIDGRERSIEVPKPILMGSTVVRVNLVVLG
jgi:hypothetical protein